LVSLGFGVFWLHHPLNVGIRMPTLIRRRLSSRQTDTTGAVTRLAVYLEDIRPSG
jgi:hypothetical protein